jgi:hypothetical protein
MIESEILQEKYRVQKRLSAESTSVYDYLLRAHLATSHGFLLQYAELPNKKLQPTVQSAARSARATLGSGAEPCVI